ncbi:FixH family protein [Rhodopila sp.]|uniref:FixH family protein n=1 Tax=Rhodopila sp. TaxID=2480087 RepID=UPI003D1438EE
MILAAACLLVGLMLISMSVRAAAPDYRFEVTDVRVVGPGKTDVVLRLLHLPDKDPVSGAVILQVSADRAPDGMPTIKASAKPLPASQPGVYIIEVERGRPGNWALRLAAKVRGEPETLRATVPVKLGN